MSEEYKRGYMDACREICTMIIDKQCDIRALKEKYRTENVHLTADQVIYFLKLMVKAIAEHCRVKIQGSDDNC